jgi:hypothetical protein
MLGFVIILVGFKINVVSEIFNIANGIQDISGAIGLLFQTWIRLFSTKGR